MKILSEYLMNAGAGGPNNGPDCRFAYLVLLTLALIYCMAKFR